jgi:hypothetical protein
MPVKRGGLRLIQVIAAVTIMGLAVAGCSKGTPTTRLVILTPPPTTETPSPVATPTPALATPTPKASSSPTLAEPTTPPVATAVPSTACTGSASNQAFWADAAKAMSFDVYCLVLPSGWSVSDGSFEGAGGGKVHMTMHGPGGAKLQIDEGAFCTSGLDTCSPHDATVGDAAFGDLIGSLDSAAGGTYYLYVNAGTAKGYTLTGSGMSQDTFVAYASAIVKVAKA